MQPCVASRATVIEEVVAGSGRLGHEAAVGVGEDNEHVSTSPRGLFDGAPQVHHMCFHRLSSSITRVTPRLDQVNRRCRYFFSPCSFQRRHADRDRCRLCLSRRRGFP